MAHFNKPAYINIILKHGKKIIYSSAASSPPTKTNLCGNITGPLPLRNREFYFKYTQFYRIGPNTATPQSLFFFFLKGKRKHVK
jgi:hypothetical protein